MGEMRVAHCSKPLCGRKPTRTLPPLCCSTVIVTAAPAFVPVMRPLPRSADVTWIPESDAAPSAASHERSKLAGTIVVCASYGGYGYATQLARPMQTRRAASERMR